MGPLAQIYSAGDTLKRQFRGLLDEPLGTLQQFVNHMNDRSRSLNELTTASANEFRQTKRSGGPQTEKLAGVLADAYNPAGMVVWHGSPHKFNKFDSSKIGTGEGAQAYGHGLYLAESPDVAGQYKTALRDESGIKALERRASRIESKLSDFDGTGGKARATRLESLSDAVKSRLNEKMMGESNSLYKVDLPDDQIAKMLDWDKPLSQQPEVINMLREHPEFGINSPQWQGAPAGQWESNIGARKGSDFYIRNKWADNQRATSDALRQAGIPGIRYLDGTSRGTGQGTSNFVVFPGNEGLLSILERNGQPLP